MQLTREILEADRQSLLEKVSGFNITLGYIDGLISYLDKPEPVDTPAEEEPNAHDA